MSRQAAMTARFLTLVAVIWTGCPLSSHAQDAPGRKHKSLPDLDVALGLTATALPEVSVPALLKIYGAASNVPKDRRIGILNDTFQQAALLRTKTHLEPAVGIRIDSRVGYLFQSQTGHRDTLSAQVAAIRSLVQVAPEGAPKLFADIKPPVPQCDCKSAWTPDNGVYVDGFASVFQQGFSPDRRKRGEDLQLALDVFRNVTDVSLFGPLVRWLSSSNISAGDRSMLAMALAGSMERLPVHSRQLEQIIKSFQDLLRLKAVVGQSDAAYAALTSVVRSAILKGLQAELCSDVVKLHLTRDPQVHDRLYGRPALPEFVARFNRDIRANSTAAIEPEDIQYGRQGPTAEQHPFWVSTRGRHVMSLMRKYTQARSQGNNSSADTVVQELLNEVSGWRDSEESAPIDWLAQRLFVIQIILPSLAPRDAIARAYIQEMVEVLSDKRLRDADPSAWAELATRPLRPSRSSSTEHTKTIHQSIASAYLGSNDPTLALLGHLYQLSEKYGSLL